MLDISKVDLTSKNQKFFAALLLVGFVVILNYLLPPIVTFFKNLWLAIFLGGPIILFTLYAAFNPMAVWNVFKQLSWALTKWMVSKDKLGYMYRYHEYILMKIKKLDGNITNVTAAKVKIHRKIGEIQSRLEDNKAQYVEYEKKKAGDLVLKALQNKVNIDDKQLKTLLPQYVIAEKQEAYLKELYTTWSADAADLKYLLDAKADEYKLLKEVSGAMDGASEFLQGNSEEFKIYQESLNQIEADAAKYTANIDSFERKAQPILTELSMQRSVSEDAGLKLIEEFKAKTADINFKTA